MRIAIVGAGAVGAVMAGFMFDKGEDVTLVTGKVKQAKLINKEGIHVCGVRGEHTFFPPAIADILASPEEYDIIIIATQAYDLHKTGLRAKRRLAEDGALVAVQNGMYNAEFTTVGSIYRSVFCVADWGSVRLSDNSFALVADGGFKIGSHTMASIPKIELIKYALDSMAPTEVCADIEKYLNTMFIISSCVICGGVLTGETLGDMLERAEDRRFFIRLIGEYMTLFDYYERETAVFHDKFDPHAFVRGTGPLADAKRHRLLKEIGEPYRALRSSSLSSLERKNKTEAAYLCGAVIGAGWGSGFDSPLNAAVNELIDEITAGKRQPRPENIAAAMALADAKTYKKKKRFHAK